MNTNKPERGLASKGIEFYPNYTGEDAKCLNYCINIGDIKKSEREELDATCFDDEVEQSIPGIGRKLDNFEVGFLYNANEPESDYQVLSKLEDKGESVPIMVKMPDGCKFTNSGTPTLAIGNTAVNSRIEATVSYKLDGEWSRTFPTNQ